MDEISLETENNILRDNIRDLQEQLQNAYIRVRELREELDNTKVCECPPIVTNMDARG
jgi:predicted RNase H-like nuclease (RuvC/YqgF family)|tara:strand:+ start:505 stop:678 length:174 start_codon:yes stop_codon:yes gene_type:complete